jgi:glycine C-acetyltransferase
MGNASALFARQLQELKNQGLFRPPVFVEGSNGPVCHCDGRKVINFASSNYLGLNTHPRVVAVAKAVLDESGVGVGAVRSVTGNTRYHRSLEIRLADFLGTEDCLIFPSGYSACSGALAALACKEDMIISDELNHASAVDGSRISGAEKKIYPHKDAESLRIILEDERPIRQKWVVTDGVFGMEGDIAPLPDIVRAVREHEAFLIVNDSHGVGVLGKNGRGTVAHHSCEGKVSLIIGSLSKALGAMGGFAAGSKDTVQYLLYQSRPLLFSTSLPAHLSAAAYESIDILEKEPERLATLWERARFFREGLESLGFNTGSSETPIIPVMAGESYQALHFMDELIERGVLVQSVAFPVVPKGKARVLATVSAGHTKDHLARALEAFEKAARKLKILQ